MVPMACIKDTCCIIVCSGGHVDGLSDSHQFGL